VGSVSVSLRRVVQCVVQNADLLRLQCLDSAVSVATGYCLNVARVVVRIPVDLHIAQNGSGANPSS
jgi:hypothetical protein